MVRVALTGGIASGKTAVSEQLATLGAVIIDSDLLARRVVEPGTPGLAAIVERFGPEVLAGSALDRARLGAIIFADPTARQDLEKIIHPGVRDLAAELEQSAPAGSVIVQVIPLLVETGKQGDFDVVVVVDVDLATQRRRLSARDELTDAEVLARINAQTSRADRLAVADFVLDNSGSPAELIDQVAQLWRKLQLHDSVS